MNLFGFREILAYGFVAICAFSLDMAIFLGATELLKVNYLVSATAAFLAGATLSYCLSVKLVFRFRRVADRRMEAAIFCAIGVAGLVLNNAIIYAAVSYMEHGYAAAKILAATGTFSCNFFLRKILLFSRFTRATSLETSTP